ncbi:VCBS repeat-containing protein [bacterium]|nr:VCBS repeat-containing protein [bacterium]
MSCIRMAIITVLCLLPTIALASSELIILKSKDISEMRDCIDKIEAKGVRVSHVFPPCVVIGDSPSPSASPCKNIPSPSAFSASPRENIPSPSASPRENIPSVIKAIYQGRVPDDVIQSIPSTSRIGIRVWNARFIPSPRTKAPTLPAKELLPPSNDCRILKKQPLTMPAPPLKAPPYGGNFYDTSNYIAGRIAVGIILPESSGNTENWTIDEANEAISKIQAAMDWWASIEPDSHLSFYYDIHTPFDGTMSVTTATEPITTNTEKTWIKQVMNGLGYTDPGQGIVEDYFYYVFDYNNDIRDMFGTHWAFTIFAADSSNDSDGCFPNGGFAYSYLGGPFVIMTYDNQNYGIENMDSVCAHETGHIFYALDEYSGASSKTERSGYLDVINANHASNPNSVPCIMKGLIDPFTNHQVCYYTKGQMGLWDTDNDNILDVIDSPPMVSLTPYSPDPTSNTNPTYTGRASVTAVPNKNPQENPPIHNITINTITNVEYRIDSGSWSAATAMDSTFDEPEEDFTFTSPTLSNGTYTFRARAIDSAGNISNYATDLLTIETYDHVPGSFSLISPANAAVIGVLSLEFDWEDAVDTDPNDAVSYILWYGKDANFATKTEVSGLPLSKYITAVNLDDNSTYYWKVCAVDKSGNKTWSKQVWSFSTQQITITIEAIFSHTANEIPTTPVVGDLDGDGLPEIVYGGIPTQGSFSSSHIYVFRKHADNSVEVVWCKQTSGACLGVALGDLNNDGLPEIAAYTYNQAQNRGTLLAINPDSTIRWATPISNKGFPHPDVVYQRDPSLGDVNGDGCSDVVINACDGSLHVISGKDGKEIWYKEFSGNYTGYCGKTAVVDLDHDGKPEVIVAATSHFSVYRYDGSLWWDKQGCDFAIADLDGDKKPEIVVIGYTGVVQAYRYNGREFWSCKYKLADSAGPAIADIDGDKKPEVVLPVENNYICAINGEDGSLLWKTENLFMGKWEIGDLIITDLNDDGLLEIVGMSQKKAIVLLDAKTGKVIVNLGINIDFASMSPVVADVDNDGHAEILVSSGEVSDAKYKGQLIVLGDDANWKACRKVWNQISYYMTNIDAELLPTTDLSPWLSHNTWRAQLPGFTDSKRGVVIGNVTDTQEQPISGAMVQSILNGVVQGSAITKPDGTYKIILLIPGRYTISVLSDGFFPASRTNTPIILGSITNKIDFQLEKMPGEASDVSVSPETYSMSIFETHVFTAEVIDSDGKKVVDGTGVKWQTGSGMVVPTISYTINGIATATYIAPSLSGIATVTAIASSTLMPQDSAQVIIGVGMPYRLELLPRELTVQAGGTSSFTVQAYDRSWQEIQWLEYRWDIVQRMGSLSCVMGTTNTFTAGGQLGTETIVVNCASMTAAAKATIIPGELHHIVITPETSTIEVGNTVGFTAAGYDQYNNPISGLVYNWQTDSSLGSFAMSTFTAGTRTGTLTINASLETITEYAAITIIPGRLHHIMIEPDTAAVQAQSQQVFYARGYDQYNNYLPGILFDWTIEDELGSLSTIYGSQTTLTAGSFIMEGRIIASSSGISGYATVTITTGELGYFQFEQINNQHAGNEFAITITARDKDGNIIKGYDRLAILNDTTNPISPQISGSFSLGVWTGSVSITKATTGITIKAEEKDGRTGMSNRFDILPGSVSWIEIIPNYQEVMAGQTTTVTAKAYDSFNNPIPGTSFSWRIIPAASGRITQTGIFTAGTRTGSLSLVALNNGQSATASILIIPGVLDHFEFGNIPHQVAGKGFPISIIAHDRYHNLVNIFADMVDLFDTTGSVRPKQTGAFSNGSWNGTVTINKLMLSLNIRAKYHGVYGTSNLFSALIDDDTGITTIGSVTIQLNSGAVGGTDYYLLITPDASSMDIETANKGLYQHPWVKQMMCIGVSLVDGDNKPLLQGFDVSAVVTVPYQCNLDDRGSLRLYQLDSNQWKPLSIQPQIDSIEHRILFVIPCPGTYTLVYNTAQPNLEALVVYPIPFRQSAGDTHIIFKGLTNDAAIRIYDLSGDIIREQEHVFTVWKWPVMDEGISSGVYFYVVMDKEGRKRVGRIVIIR